MSYIVTVTKLSALPHGTGCIKSLPTEKGAGWKAVVLCKAQGRY